MESILAIATILGGITAIWFFWEQLSVKTDILNEVKIRIEDINSPNWASDTAMLNFNIYNQSEKSMLVSNVSIVVIEVNQQFELKESLAGAPHIPIKGTANILAKKGEYPIIFDDNVTKFKYQIDDMDSFLIKITFQEGYIYKFKISASTQPLRKKSSKKIESEVISYISKVSSAELALKKLKEME